MGKGRVEAFSDGVIAIVITIMVLELEAPHTTDWESLQALMPVFLSYALSFVFLGIYWSTTTTTCSRRSSRSTAVSCGPTCICSSGCL